jgi:hypothetical protein
MAHMLSASGRGNMLSSRSQRNGQLKQLNTSRRERALLDLTKTQVKPGKVQTKLDEVANAFGTLLKPAASARYNPTSSRQPKKSLPSRTTSASRLRTSARKRPGRNKSSKVTGQTVVTPPQVKHTIRNSWYRLRSTVQSFGDIGEGTIQLGQMYALCQNHLLGLDTDQTSALLADIMGSNAQEDFVGAATTTGGIDTMEVPAMQALPYLEKMIQTQWDRFQNALATMPIQLTLENVQKKLKSHSIILTVGELCHVPDWTSTLSNGMASSRSQKRLLHTRQGNPNMKRMESILKTKIKRSWRRMNEVFRKESKESRRNGKVDVRQLNSVLSKFGVQLAHDDLLALFSKFDEKSIGL